MGVVEPEPGHRPVPYGGEHGPEAGDDDAVGWLAVRTEGSMPSQRDLRLKIITRRWAVIRQPRVWRRSGRALMAAVLVCLVG